MHIRKQSLEENEDGSRGFSHIREIVAHIGLMTDTQQGRSAVGKEITKLYFVMGYWDADDFHNTNPKAFLKIRPDGIAFNKKANVCAFLEFTRPIDSRDGASEQADWYTGADWSLDWAQDKDLEKNTRSARHLEYICWASQKKGETWTTAQYNFTVGVRGSAIEAAWEDRLPKVGLDNAKLVMSSDGRPSIKN